MEADCDEAVWCNIVTRYSTLTSGLVYKSPDINEEDNTKIQNSLKEVSEVNKQGKWSRKKHLSKKAIRKIAYKQTIWKVYRRSRKDEDYTNYKEALNAAMTEIRQSKRSYEQKLACNIKNYSKSFYSYVRS